MRTSSRCCGIHPAGRRVARLDLLSAAEFPHLVPECGRRRPRSRNGGLARPYGILALHGAGDQTFGHVGGCDGLLVLPMGYENPALEGRNEALIVRPASIVFISALPRGLAFRNRLPRGLALLGLVRSRSNTKAGDRLILRGVESSGTSRRAVVRGHEAAMTGWTPPRERHAVAMEDCAADATRCGE